MTSVVGLDKAPGSKSSKQTSLDSQKVEGVLAKDGLLGRTVPGYEERPQQKEMLRDVIEAYNEQKILLVEAGTGTGKSLAYLIPAMLWALYNQERTVISTNTITLQEQLLNKDIPFLIKTLNIDLKVALVKGMNNYLCLRKLQDVGEERRLLFENEAQELEKIEQWSQNTKEGSRSDLPFVPTAATWERVGAESDACSRSRCPHYKECFFFKARRQADDAQIIVANHHLLFADIVARAESEGGEKGEGILPSYTRIVLDEAHHLEDVATEYFASRATRLYMMRLMHRLMAEKRLTEAGGGKLNLLKEKIVQHFSGGGSSGKGSSESSENVQAILGRLDLDLPGEKLQLMTKIHEAFQAVTSFFEEGHFAVAPAEGSDGTESKKWRLRAEHFDSEQWKMGVQPLVKRLAQGVQQHIQGLRGLEEDISNLGNDGLDEKTRNLRLDIKALGGRLEEISTAFYEFAFAADAVDRVRWIEAKPLRTTVNIECISAVLDVAPLLAKHLFNKFSTIVLCSATLTTQKNFSFIRQRLGILPEFCPEKLVEERIYDSPFNYAQQAMLVVPSDMPSPYDLGYMKRIEEQVWQAIQASRGNAFVLFTSFQMLKTCYEALFERLKVNRFHVFKQGDDNRQALLNKFRTTEYSVLFGTDSFWEGVDVVGDALRCVIIVKLPFKVPSEPLIQARCERITARGGNPFMDYTVPQAIVKFKQGFGRLIRNQRDRGCVVCLDSRLLTKGYGKAFINSLPKCQQLIDKGADLQAAMQEFYRKTYYLTKKE